MRTERARRALQFVGLGERERRTSGQLSGGQQQRVAIARALINTPSLLLADEPTGNLDTRTSHEIMEMLVALNRDRGLTIVLVTHELDIATYASRVVTMRDGEIVSDERNAERPPAAAPGKSVVSMAVPQPPRQEAPPRPVGHTIAFGLMILAAAAQAIGRNKMRSALTMLGVFIGVAALIIMVAVGDGAREAVRKQIEKFWDKRGRVFAGYATRPGAFAPGFGSASTLTVADARAIRRDDEVVAQVGYLIRQQGQVQFGLRLAHHASGRERKLSVHHQLAHRGRAGNNAGRREQGEPRRRPRTDSLPPALQPLCEPNRSRDRDSGRPLRVIGLLIAKGQSAFGQDQDDLVMMPFTTGERKVLGRCCADAAAKTPLNWPYLPPPNPYNLQPRMTGFANQI